MNYYTTENRQNTYSSFYSLFIGLIFLLGQSSLAFGQKYNYIHEQLVYDFDLKKQFTLTDSSFQISRLVHCQGDSLSCFEFRCEFRLFPNGIIELTMYEFDRGLPIYSYWLPDLSNYKMCRIRRNPKRVRIKQPHPADTIYSKVDGLDSLVVMEYYNPKEKYSHNINSKQKLLYRNDTLVETMRADFFSFYKTNASSDWKDSYKCSWFSKFHLSEDTMRTEFYDCRKYPSRELKGIDLTIFNTDNEIVERHRYGQDFTRPYKLESHSYREDSSLQQIRVKYFEDNTVFLYNFEDME